ncbi:hypothetical protein AYO22_06522 [Fonsecaea multimorphosa]|nr:hypothetical protein AYO22_06522 [Fonsecaea multimorphosa]
MTGCAVVRKRNIKCRTKVKTGCATCRVRKVKCDENKPFCQKCVSTGRTCDGYQSPFIILTSQQPINNAHAGKSNSDVAFPSIRPTFTEIAPEDIDLLNRYFSTKTLFDVVLGCDEEARQILQASLTDPPIRHAVLSLKALREDLETFGDDLASVVAQQSPSQHYGLQQYSMALRGLASNLSSLGSNGLKSVLLCCQIFISIEQVRKNYTAMAQHIIQGLRIMHEHRARPGLLAGQKLVPAHHDQLPLLDVFIIKLFAAPCKFADPPPPTTADAGGTTLFAPHQMPVGACDLRTIAPDMRTGLTRIAASTLDFLDKVSQVQSVESALGLLPQKAALLDSLESWLLDLDLVQKTDVARPSSPEPISVSFLRLFHLVLKIVLMGALNPSPDLGAQLRTDTDRLQDVANNVGERVRAYTTCSGSSGGRGERSTALC